MSSHDTILRWSREIPAGPGFYWYREPESNLLEVVRVYRSGESPLLFAAGVRTSQRIISALDGQWAGPIREPIG